MRKILLVEDSKFLRLSTERALARAGYSVSSASDGTEALRLAQAQLPDIVLLDMMLPKMSGSDVLKAMKGNPATQSIPVIIISGLSERNAARLKADGAAAMFEKGALELDKSCTKLLAVLERTMGESKFQAKAGSAEA